MLNLLSKSNNYNSQLTRRRNVAIKAAQGLSGVTVGGGINELQTRIRWAQTNCSPLKEALPECSGVLKKIDMEGGYAHVSVLWVDTILQFVLDHPKLFEQAQSKKYLRHYDGIKTSLGSLPFYLLAIMEIAANIKDKVPDEIYWLFEFFPALLLAFFANPEVREKMRLQLGGQPYAAAQAGQDPRGRVPKAVDGLFGLVGGFALGRGFISLLEEIILNFVNVNFPKKTRWIFGALLGGLQGMLNIAHTSPGAPAFFQPPAGWREKLAYMPPAVYLILTLALLFAAFPKMLGLKTSHKITQLILTCTPLAFNLLRALLISPPPAPSALVAPLLAGAAPPPPPAAGSAGSLAISSDENGEVSGASGTVTPVKPASEGGDSGLKTSTAIRESTSANFSLRCRLSAKNKTTAALTYFFSPPETAKARNIVSANYPSAATKLKAA